MTKLLTKKLVWEQDNDAFITKVPWGNYLILPTKEKPAFSLYRNPGLDRLHSSNSLDELKQHAEQDFQGQVEQCLTVNWNLSEDSKMLLYIIIVILFFVFLSEGCHKSYSRDDDKKVTETRDYYRL